MPIKHLFRAALLMAACAMSPLATARDAPGTTAAAATAAALLGALSRASGAAFSNLRTASWSAA